MNYLVFSILYIFKNKKRGYPLRYPKHRYILVIPALSNSYKQQFHIAPNCQRNEQAKQYVTMLLKSQHLSCISDSRSIKLRPVKWIPLIKNYH